MISRGCRWLHPLHALRGVSFIHSFIISFFHSSIHSQLERDPQVILFGSVVSYAQNLSFLSSYQWCLLPQHTDGAALISNPLTDVSDLCWGAWLPGSGEVMLGVRDNILTCWEPCRETQGWLQLGPLPTAASHCYREVTWAASLRHVAVVSQAEALHVYSLQPGPRLDALHTIHADHVSYGTLIAFSPDSRYLLHRQVPTCVRLFTRTMDVLVMHVASGKTSKVVHASPQSDLLSAFWVPSGVRVETLPDLRRRPGTFLASTNIAIQSLVCCRAD